MQSFVNPIVRVYVPTFRRAHLLPRALHSLRAQTYPHWIAEVRNDAPDDDTPNQVVAALADPRIHYVRHPHTIGGAAVFNLVFSHQTEPFVALLEDDNWWQPEFLARMLAALEANPDATLAWSNQGIWEELSEGAWRDTGRLVRPLLNRPGPFLIPWGQPIQCLGALHANGTMLLRTRRNAAYPTPAMELGGTEAVRERALPHPLLYVPEPLGVFAVTRVTNRSRDPSIWATNQVLLAASFLLHVPAPDEYWRQLWAQARAARPRMTGTLLLATQQDSRLRRHLAFATRDDYLHLATRSVRRPTVFLKLRRARRRATPIWEFLDRHTAARTREREVSGAPPPTYSQFPPAE